MMESVIEAILFASGDPIHISRICSALDIDRSTAESVLEQLGTHYERDRRGIRLLRLEDSYQLCTAPEYAGKIRKALEMRVPQKLSIPSMEVLAIVAYYQPITRARIEQIRGLDCTYIISQLVDMNLIERCGQMSVAGSPTLYRTTTEFLRYFHFSNLCDLPEFPNELKDRIEESQINQDPGLEIDFGTVLGPLPD